MPQHSAQCHPVWSKTLSGEARAAQAGEVVRRFAERLREALHLEAAAMWEDVANAIPVAVVDDRRRRRLWLLTEAVKHVPLAEALTIARAAETLLSARRGQRPTPGDNQAVLDALIRRGLTVRRFRPPAAARLRDQ
jgi:hypothetical protein